MTDTFLDFEIHISARRDDHYPVNIQLGRGQNFAGELAVNPDAWTPTDDSQADGQRLFAAIFADPELRRAWDEARGQSSRRRVRLWIDTEAPELHTLPWELLHEGQTFLAADAATPFSRYLPSDAPWGGLVTERPIRILAVISNPTDLAQQNLAPLDVAVERALLTDALGDLAPTHFRLETLEAPVTLERLERALASGPHVLHFVGHGAFNVRRQEAALYLQDANGNTQSVTDAQLCDMLRRQATLPSLIFLAACQSAERSTVDAFAGFAPKLVQAGVPAVVAMQDKVALAATRKLTPVFYEELARHGEVDRALNAARSLLLTGQSPDAATPVLLMRLKGGELWEPLWTKTNPYCGLAAFTESDAPFFFGREKLVGELVAHLRKRNLRFLVVIGPSGSGKSSVVQAGLIPALRQGVLHNSQYWKIVICHPATTPNLIAFGKSISPKKERGVLFIDQFEELFTQHTEDVQFGFLTDLKSLIESDLPITVILTLRADFYGYLLRHSLGKLLSEAQVNVLPMEPADLRAAIEMPAHKVDLRFENGLVEKIVEDTQRAEHALPLLQSALAQMCQRQEHGVFTCAAYDEVGQVAGALGQWAEKTYHHLSETEQTLTRRIFTRLVHYGETDTGQRRLLRELATSQEETITVHALVRRLADARLLVTGNESIEIIHDALLQEWHRLRGWITEQREFYLWRQRLETQQRLWEDKGRDTGALLHGALLIEAERWLQEKPEEINRGERIYIQAGIDGRECEQQVQEIRRRRALGGMATAVALLFVLSVVASMGWRSSSIKEQARATAQAEAVAEANRALNAEATAKARRVEAVAEKLVAQAQRVFDNTGNNLIQSTLLSIESLNHQYTSDGEQILRQRLRLIPNVRVNNTYAGSLGAVRFSVDGKLIAAENDNFVQVFEAINGRQILQLDCQATVSALAFSPNGQLIASGTSEGNIQIWDIDTGNQIVNQVLHSNEIYNLEFTSDSQSVISAGYDNTILIWNINTGKEIFHIEGNNSHIMAVGFDGHRIASVGRNDSHEDLITVWNADNGQQLIRIESEDSIYSVAFSSDGNRIAAGSGVLGGMGQAQVWDIATGAEIFRGTHEGGVWDVTFSPDDRWLATGSMNFTARVWEVDTGREMAVMRHEDFVREVSFSSDGKWLATRGDDSTTRVWQPLTGMEVGRMVHQGAVCDMAFSPNSRWVATSSSDGSIRIWEAFGVQNLFSVDGFSRFTPDQWVSEDTFARFSPNDQWIIVVYNDGTARLFESITGNEIARFSNENEETAINTIITGAIFSPDGKWLVTRGGYVVKVWEVGTWNEIIRIEHPFTVRSVFFSPDVDWILTQDERTVILWNPNDRGDSRKISFDFELRHIEFSPDGQKLATLSNYVDLWDVNTLNHQGQIVTEGELKYSAFNPNPITKNIATLSGKVIEIWDVNSLQKIQTITLQYDDMGMVFSPDGKQILTGGFPMAQVWNANNGKEISSKVHGCTIYTWEFTPSGEWVISGGGDGRAQVWDAATSQDISLLTHKGWVWQAVFTERQIVATTDYLPQQHRIMRLWDTSTGTEIFQVASDRIHFSSDGNYFVTSDSGMVQVWRLWLENPVAEACARMPRNLSLEEWKQYLGDEPYRATCPNLPIPEE